MCRTFHRINSLNVYFYMKIFKHKTFNSSRLHANKVLDLGCGKKKLAGATGVDHIGHPGVDIVANLNDSLPFADDEYDVVHLDQVLEHIPNMLGLIDEIHRILKPSGILVIHVPYFRSNWSIIDPTHVRFFCLKSMDYFVDGTWMNSGYRFSDRSFKKLETFLDTDYPPNFFRWLFTNLALKFSNRFENSILSFIYPFEQLTFVLTK